MKNALMLLLACIAFVVQAQVSITDRYEVQAGNDDAEESVVSGAIDIGSSDLELITESTEQIVGIRFANINIPQGATINSAFIQFTVDEADAIETNLIFEGELVANAEPFSSELMNISMRATTEAAVEWNNVPAWNVTNEAGPDQQTPDLTSIISEIINQPDWAAGNALSIIISGSGKRTAISKNKDAPSPAQLIVNYNISEFPIQNYPIARESVWKYLDNGTSLDGENWTAIDYNDTSWAFGQGKLGYGDDNENTTLSFGPDPDNKYPTYYFRKTFQVDDPTALDSFTINVLRDDGAVVYLNGSEVFRSNMPEGEIGYNTLAANTVGGADEDGYIQSTIASALMSGLNVLAVEVHQASLGSSDVGFDLFTTEEVQLPPAVQLIHNSPDPSLSLISVYLDIGRTGNFINSTGSTPFPFRAATEFLTDLPAGDHSLAIAPFGTEEFEWSTFDFSIEANKRYIIIASGLRDPSQYNSTINTEEQMAFRIQMVEVPLRENIETDEVFLVLDHGVSDLPNIRLIAPGVGDATAALPTGLPLDFMLIGGGVPAFDFPLVQVTDNTTTEIFGAYKLNFASRFGQAATILTSGFFSSEGNTDIDEPTFGTFIVPEEGGFFEALGDPDPPVPGTIDILHASPDPSLTEVDVYVNGEKAISNLGYLQASGRVDIPAGLNRLAISPVGDQVDTSWSATEILIDSDINPNTLLIEGFNYTAGVYGLRDPMTVPNSTNEITFSLVQTDARLSSVDSANTDILFLHAALDAPTIDLFVDGQFVPIIDDISFGMFSPTYVSLPANNIYQINITAQDDREIIKAYTLDLTGLAGQALNVVIAGELESPEPDFAVYLSSADTNVLTALSEVTITTVEDLNALGIQVFPNPIRDILQIQSDGNIRAVEILSIHGKSILVEDNISTHWSKSLDHLVAGDYIIVIRTNEATFGLPLVKL